MEQIPDWMNNNFFAQCLQKETGKQGIEITNFRASSAAPPGNNYGSITTRVIIEYKNSKTDQEVQMKSLIVKTEVTHGPLKEFTADLKLIEPTFYYQFIARSSNYCDTLFVPKSLYSPRPDVTILEDLKDKGFVMADRLKQLDFDHCHLYMTAAATMHAVSVPVFKEFPEIKEAIGQEKMFTDESKGALMLQGMIKGGMRCFAEAIEKIEKFKKFTDTIDDVAPHLWTMLVDSHRPSKFLNTLNQGDPWTTNMMFKYNGQGVVSEIKLLDFQCLRYGSPINDVVYFIWSSANNDVKKHKLEELYHIYLDSFNGKLEELNCAERLTYEQLIDNVKKLYPLTLLFAACNLPLVCHPDPLDMADFMPKGSEELDTAPVFKRYFNNNFCTNYLPPLLECLEVNGVFDYFKALKK